jgi:hypothetical protein
MDRALAKRAEDRYSSAAEFASAMQLVLQGATQLPPHLVPKYEMSTTPAIVPLQMQQPQAQVAMQPAQAAMQPPPQQRPMMPNGPQQAPMAQMPSRGSPLVHGPPARARSSVGLLVGVALGFLLLGVTLAVLLMKFVVR